MEFTKASHHILIQVISLIVPVIAKDTDGVLTPTRILRWATGSIGRADVSSAGLLVADGTNLAYVALGDG